MPIVYDLNDNLEECDDCHGLFEPGQLKADTCNVRCKNCFNAYLHPKERQRLK